MGLSETLLFYVMIGLGVAVAVWCRSDSQSPCLRVLQTATAVTFWPVYLPILLTPAETTEVRRRSAHVVSADPVAGQIADVERELRMALSSLDGWAEEILDHERSQFDELFAAWTAQAERLRQLDSILAIATPVTDCSDTSYQDSRAQRFENSRKANFVRLQQIRRQGESDLQAGLAKVREVISLIHLARFTGAPASRTDELIQQIAASVEGLSEVVDWNAPESAEVVSALVS